MSLQNINITGIESKQFDTATQYTLLDGRTKYKFYSHKVDGSESKAYQQFQSAGLKAGMTIEAEVKEDEKEYQGKKYTDRRIMFFKIQDGQKPAATPVGDYITKDAFEFSMQAINANTQKIVEKIKDLEGRIEGLETILLAKKEGMGTPETTKEALDVHQKLAKPAEVQQSALGEEYDNFPTV